MFSKNMSPVRKPQAQKESSINNDSDEEVQIDSKIIYTFLNMQYARNETERDLKKPFELFNTASIRQYVADIKTCEDDYALTKDFKAAIKAYSRLILDYAYFPDAYLALGELYLKHKDPENAIFFFEQYQDIVNVDNAIEAKIAFARDALNKLYPDNPPYPNNNLKLALAQAAERKKNETVRENDYRRWYHCKLRQLLLPMKLPPQAPIMLENLADDIDYTDPELSNYAVIDAYRGKAMNLINQPRLADFYYQKAIIKFPRDFISISKCAANAYNLEDNIEEALAQLSTCIENYEYSYSYYLRYAINRIQGDMTKAKCDLVMALVNGDKMDLDDYQIDRERIIADLYGCIVRSAPFLSSQMTVDTAWKKILSCATAIGKGIKKSSYQEEIRLVSQLLNQNNFNSQYYRTRALFYLNSLDADNALIDYSLAIMFGMNSQTQDLYVGRFIIHLAKGNLKRASNDLDNALFTLEKNNYNGANKLLKLFCDQCIDKSKLHIENGNFALAEKICLLGTSRYKSFDLYIQHALTVGLQERYTMALSILANIRKLVPVNAKQSDIIDRHYKNFSTQQLRANSDPIIPITIPKKKKRRSRLAPPKTQAHKKGVTSTTHIHELFKEEKSQASATLLDDDLLIAQEKAELLHKEAAEKSKRKAKYARVKSKKAELRQQRRALGATHSATAGDVIKEDLMSDGEDADLSFAPDIPLAETKPLTQEMLLELLPLETQLFALFAQAKTAYPTSKTYIVGGWSYDRVHAHVFNTIHANYQNDIDIVTDIPMPELQRLFPAFKVIPQVKGLMQGKVAGCQIDIVYRDNLKSLHADARSRDFLCFYLDDNGRVFDPTGFALTYMHKNILKSVSPKSMIFKRDPLIILRAIYMSIKRHLLLNSLRSQIRIDKVLLRPSISSKEEDRLLHPQRFNSLIKKNFSQQRAGLNYELMDQLGVIEVLFPQLYCDLEKNKDWIRNAMAITDAIDWPKLEVIYANLIACAVAPRALAALPAALAQRLEYIREVMTLSGKLTISSEGYRTLEANTELSLINQYAQEVIQSSLLFSQLEQLPHYIPRACQEWRAFQALQVELAQSSEEKSQSAPRMAR